MQISYSKNNKRLIITIALLSVFLIVLFLVSMCVGRYRISIQDTFKVLFGQETSDMAYRVIIYLRLPRTIIAVLVGVALSVSGANAMADT